ncbi:MAG: hypothetical protein C4518_14305 [Desulfobacteraceae bacterium]|nr:MAG: hypothetical protein C4518_14305 [Desulfobacteraceae bacterium]
MKIFKAGILYFICVFGAGFILGPIRLFFVVPRLGTRMAELMEMPIMIAVMIVAARWIVRRFSVPQALCDRLGMGIVALCLLLTAEFSLVLALQGISITEYLATRDPVSGTAYYLSLGLFALMPLLVERR